MERVGDWLDDSFLLLPLFIIIIIIIFFIRNLLSLKGETN